MESGSYGRHAGRNPEVLLPHKVSPRLHRSMMIFCCAVCRAARAPMSDDLSSLKDDMNAFILGHCLSRFQGYVTEEVHSVMWDPKDNPESWKDFVELAKKAGSQFLSMDEEVLQRDELDYLVQRLQHASFPSEEDLDEARWLRNYLGKTGFIQLGWPHQGIMFLFEATTEWYER